MQADRPTDAAHLTDPASAVWAEALEGRTSSMTALPPIPRQLPGGLPPDHGIVDASALIAGLSDGVSPTRRSRKKALLGHSDGGRSPALQASMVLDSKEKDMVLTRENKQSYSRVLLELWVNQILDPTPGGSTLPISLPSPLHVDPSACRGLAAYGLTRVELLGSGLGHDAVDRLYRCMYVYSIGFFDVVQDILLPTEFRTEILSNVWKGFLHIAESALQVAFKSDYLKLYTSQQVAVSALLSTKEALAEAHKEGEQAERTVGWLTHAHSEERALKQALKVRLEEAGAALARERCAHQAACTHYVEEVKQRVQLSLQLQAYQLKLSEAAVSQAGLIAQRDDLLEKTSAAQERCVQVYALLDSVSKALAMEQALSVAPAAAVTEAAAGGGTPGLEALAHIVKEMVVQLHTMWRKQSEDLKRATLQLHAANDDLRVLRTDAHDLEVQAKRDRATILDLSQRLSGSQQLQLDTAETLRDTAAQLQVMTLAQRVAEAEVVRTSAELYETQRELCCNTEERDSCRQQAAELAGTLERRDATVERLEGELAHVWGVTQEMSLGLALSWGALQANQTARASVVSKLGVERRRQSDLQFTLYGVERAARAMDGKIDELSRGVSRTRPSAWSGERHSCPPCCSADIITHAPMHPPPHFQPKHQHVQPLTPTLALTLQSKLCPATFSPRPPRPADRRAERGARGRGPQPHPHLHPHPHPHPHPPVQALPGNLPNPDRPDPQVDALSAELAAAALSLEQEAALRGASEEQVASLTAGGARKDQQVAGLRDDVARLQAEGAQLAESLARSCRLVDAKELAVRWRRGGGGSTASVSALRRWEGASGKRAHVDGRPAVVG
ncbi:MAG: hypothetical protein WDW36_010066 [Sanguina aurantia]